MFSRQDYQYFKKAKEISKNSDFNKIHIGCIAVYQGNIIGVGYNSNKTHPVQKYYNKYIKDKLGRAAVCLPSTSPANAAWSIERLVGAWRIINE